MKNIPVVFLAGERQHAGKTVTSLGIISAISDYIDPHEIGYFKPVGQEMVTLANGERIDKDVQIVHEFTDLHMPDLGMLSPVRVVDGVTRDYLASANPCERTNAFEASIQKTMTYLSDKKVIFAEGTGHPGVGSVIGLSNAYVANVLNARILYLVGGGIGRTIDELEVDLSYFSHHHSRVAGVLFNKVLPQKIEGMRAAVNEAVLARLFSEWDPSLAVCGYMPTVDYLNNPSMQLIARRFTSARFLNSGDPKAWKRAVRKVQVISQGADSFVPEEHLQPRDIAVLGAGSHRRLKRILTFNEALPTEKLGGIILTCSNEQMPDEKAVEWIVQSKIPAVAVRADAGEVDQVVYKCFKNTKLQTYDHVKNQQIVELFKAHFDVKRFMTAFGL